MSYYLLNQDGSIHSTANHKFHENCLETNKQIIRHLDSKLYFEDDELPVVVIPEPDDDKKKNRV